MSFSGAHRAAFRREATQDGRVFSLRDAAGCPVPERALPFWSKASRAERVVTHVPAYRGFDVVEIGIADFLDRWLPGLDTAGLLAGINWAGPRATGYDIAPARVAGWFAEQT